jgi:hypothetical protein
MLIAIRENYKPTVLRLRVLAGLLFASEWILVFRFCLQHHERKVLSIKQKIIDVTVLSFLKVLAELIEKFLSNLCVVFQNDIS